MFSFIHLICTRAFLVGLSFRFFFFFFFFFFFENRKIKFCKKIERFRIMIQYFFCRPM